MLLVLAATAMFADGPIERLQRFVSSAESIAVEMEIRRTAERAPARANVVYRRPAQLAYNLKWDKLNYAFVVSGSKVLEVEHGTRRYDAYDGPGRLIVPQSKLTFAGEDNFPYWLLSGRLADHLPPGTAIRKSARTILNGVQGETLEATYASGPMRCVFRAVLAPDGRPLYTSLQEGKARTDTYYRNYAVNQKLPKSAFALSVPPGYKAAGTHRTAPPLEPLTRPRLSGEWFTPGSKTPVTLLSALKGRLTLVAYLGKECAASKASLPALRRLGQVPVLVVTKGADDNGYGKAGFRTLYDPTGNAAAALKAPGTPAFYLVRPDGIVAASWFGYSQPEESTFVRDVRRAWRAHSR